MQVWYIIRMRMGGINFSFFHFYKRCILSDIQRDNRVVSLSSRAGIRSSLVTILDQLQRCQKSLNEFLEVPVWAFNLNISTFFFFCMRYKQSFFKWACVLLMQEKRSAFPRFYFIGDDDLLEILGQATNPNVIQSHLKKLFAGQKLFFFVVMISSLVFIFFYILTFFCPCFVIK